MFDITAMARNNRLLFFLSICSTIPYEHLSNLHLKYVFELFVGCYLDNYEQKVGNNNPFNGIQQKGV
jgi:hypothetical protein